MRSAPIVVHFKDVAADEAVREWIQKRCDHLAEEFHEVGRFELTIEENGNGLRVQGHATGKNTDVATHAEAANARVASDQVLDKIERQLRKHHDKRIFAQRREAQKHPPKKNGAA